MKMNIDSDTDTDTNTNADKDKDMENGHRHGHGHRHGQGQVFLFGKMSASHFVYKCRMHRCTNCIGARLHPALIGGAGALAAPIWRTRGEDT
jgi:hypothetical protein